jgi:hypothetical protein
MRPVRHDVRPAWFRAILVSGAAALALGACGGGSGGRDGLSPNMAASGPAPVQLGGAAAPGAAAQESVLGPLDDQLTAKAIENYRISKKRSKAPYQVVGADLNGDGVREALVLFQGKDWCTRTGCSMAVFQNFQHGLRPISRTVRVKPPVEVTDAATNGYRDLLVQTGGGPAPERRVRLQFSGDGYSRNAMLQPEVPLGSLVRTEIASAKVPANTPASAGNRPGQSASPNR